MTFKNILKNKNAMTAIYIGTLCSSAYLAVYFARNILSAVTPGMIEGGYSEEFIGKLSSVFANAVSSIGWKNLILVWLGLTISGVIIVLPFKNKKTEKLV